MAGAALGEARCTCKVGIDIHDKNGGFMGRNSIQGDNQTPNCCVRLRACWKEVHIEHMQNHAILQFQLQVDHKPHFNRLQHMGADRVNSCNAMPHLVFSSTVFYSKAVRHTYALQLSFLQVKDWVGMLIVFSYFVLAVLQLSIFMELMLWLKMMYIPFHLAHPCMFIPLY